MGILELKSTLLKLKIEIFINSFEQAEKRISEFEDRLIKIIQAEEQKKNE